MLTGGRIGGGGVENQESLHSNGLGLATASARISGRRHSIGQWIFWKEKDYWHHI